MLLRPSSHFPDDGGSESSEISVRFCEAIRRHYPYSNRHEDLKTQKEKSL